MNGVSVGYARVSSDGQDLGVQLDQLRSAGVTKIFSEKVSGKDRERPELAQCIAFLREGDTLVVARIDRLGRSVKHLLEIVEGLHAKGVKFRCLNQPMFDLTDASQKMLFQILAAFAEFETSIRAERQAEGIARAKAEGRYKGGSKSRYNSKNVISACRTLKEKYGYGAADCAKHLKMAKRTLYKHTAKADPPLWGEFKPGKPAAVEEFDIMAPGR